MNSRLCILFLAIGLSLARAGALRLSDVMISRIDSPADGDTYPLSGAVVPCIDVRNNGIVYETLWAFSRIEHTCSTHTWRDSVWLNLAAGEEQTVSFDTWFPRYPGLHRFQFSLSSPDTTPWYHFWVVGGGGVEETAPMTYYDNRAAPICLLARGVLNVPPGKPGQSTTGQSLVFLLDATGRKVLDLQPGPNDVSRFAPGVYFVRQASGVPREASCVFKVVIQR